MHRSAAMDREAVAVDPDHVDIAGPLRDPLPQDARALIDHREQQTFDDLVLAEDAACDAALRRRIGDQLLHLRIGFRGARAGLIKVETARRLLAVAATFTELVRDRRRKPLGLAHAPAYIEAGQVPHRERTHRETEIRQRAVYVLRQRALKQ